MRGTPLIQEMVREGRLSPKQGAMLLEMRRDVAKLREKSEGRRHVALHICISAAMFMLAMLGLRREDA